MTGEEFCVLLDKDVNEGKHVFGVSKANAEKSKYLQVANIIVCGFDLDITNTWNFGTAQEDAYRRDLTINSLFYNINEGMVEDFTGRGIQDLRRGVIDTPDPNMDACMKDPMVVLRAILFAARMNFDIENGIKLAA